MAPEYPPRLVVLELVGKPSELAADITYVEPVDQGQLRVRWSEQSCPPDFLPIGNGVAFVHKKPEVMLFGPTRTTLDRVGNTRWRWIQGTPDNVPWIMEIVVFPQGFTPAKSKPDPQCAKDFNGKIAAYWILKGDKQWRTAIEFDIVNFSGPLPKEVLRINKKSPLHQVPLEAQIELDVPPKNIGEVFVLALWKLPRITRWIVFIIIGIALVGFAFWKTLPDTYKDALLGLFR